jgi:hypothetical protein
MATEQCTIRHIIVVPSRIHFVRFIIEAYEGIAQVSTVDPSLGLLRLSIAPGCEEDVERIFAVEGPGLQLRTVCSAGDDCPPPAFNSLAKVSTID